MTRERRTLPISKALTTLILIWRNNEENYYFTPLLPLLLYSLSFSFSTWTMQSSTLKCLMMGAQRRKRSTSRDRRETWQERVVYCSRVAESTHRRTSWWATRDIKHTRSPPPLWDGTPNLMVPRRRTESASSGHHAAPYVPNELNI